MSEIIIIIKPYLIQKILNRKFNKNLRTKNNKYKKIKNLKLEVKVLQNTT